MTLIDLAIGLPTMLACLILQVSVTFWVVKYYLRLSAGQLAKSGWLAGIRPLMMVMVVMMAGNFLQMAIWGAIFLFLGEFDSMHAAFYHSAVNFTTLGYGDLVMSDERKLLGPLEAANGVLMFAITSAALMSVLQHMIKAHLVSGEKKQ
ncbi:potassium channel family protein [Accumulibacter sp.]|uniref:potassium channel family protein n=1 Tax=Accumulibacter sp. TaxID=2053492 RepID=UPI0025D98A39|nr:potassium channel family protein [Accumulibacter sp.]MCP5228142.1 two pore domain potassium channel family protein [Accumulibacter sp.]